MVRTLSAGVLLGAGAVAGATVIKPKTQKGEHNLNKLQTGVGLGALAATPYLVKKAFNAHPAPFIKARNITGDGIEEGSKYAIKAGKKAIEYIRKFQNSKIGKKLMSQAKHVWYKFSNSKTGREVLDAAEKFAKKVNLKKIVQKGATKASEALKKFASLSKANKGGVALAAAGTALLVHAGIKTVTNYYKKEGAIDQKYEDMHKYNMKK